MSALWRTPARRRISTREALRVRVDTERLPHSLRRVIVEWSVSTGRRQLPRYAASLHRPVTARPSQRFGSARCDPRLSLDRDGVTHGALTDRSMTERSAQKGIQDREGTGCRTGRELPSRSNAREPTHPPHAGGATERSHSCSRHGTWLGDAEHSAPSMGSTARIGHQGACAGGAPVRCSRSCGLRRHPAFASVNAARFTGDRRRERRSGSCVCLLLANSRIEHLRGSERRRPGCRDGPLRGDAYRQHRAASLQLPRAGRVWGDHSREWSGGGHFVLFAANLGRRGGPPISHIPPHRADHARDLSCDHRLRVESTPFAALASGHGAGLVRARRARWRGMSVSSAPSGPCAASLASATPYVSEASVTIARCLARW